MSTDSATFASLKQAIADRDLTIAALHANLDEMAKKLGAALFRIDQLARSAFGRSSERYDHPDQARIDLGELTPSAPAGPVTVIPAGAQGIAPGKESCANKPRRKPIPDTVERVHLPARELSLAERLLPDGRELIPIGEETHERLGYIPPKFVAEVEHLIVYGILNDLGTVDLSVPTRIATPAPQIILNGLPTTASIVQVAFNKFGLHLPLDRQSKEFARLGFHIAKSTMCGWLASFATFLEPVVKALERQVLSSALLFSDDIPEGMLDPGSGKTKQVRFWSYMGSGPGGHLPPQVLFVFTEDRRGCHPADMLKDFHGSLMADALAQYDDVVLINHIWRLLCWAHARRKFHDARDTDPRCHEMLLLIRKLNDAEDRAKQRIENDELSYTEGCRWRWRLRQSYSIRVLDRIKSRLDAWAPLIGKDAATPDSPLGKAVMYALSRWNNLTRYASTGDLPIDNNPCENIQRPIALGRKNHLFLGSEGGGKIAATCYSLIQSCRLQGIDPVAYLKGISARLLGGDTNYDGLTPLAVAEVSRKAARDLHPTG